MDEIDKATTENSNEIKKFTPPTVPSEDEIRKKEIRKIRKISYKLKWKLIS